MGKEHSRETVEAAIRKGLEYTARQLSAARFDWDAAGKCERPVTVDVAGGHSARMSDKERRLLWLQVHTPCRQCDACLRARGRLWTGRALTETAASARTWFGTFTLSPHWHHQMLTRLRARLDAQGIDYDTLSARERFAEHHGEVSKEFTKYFKRIRKASGATLRYMLVVEEHKSGGELDGFPHYHALIHEVHPDYPVSWRILTTQWPFGHSKLKLVTESQQVRYTCKYVSKDAVARIRASQRYGEPPMPSWQSEFAKEQTRPVGTPSRDGFGGDGDAANEREKPDPHKTKTSDESAAGLGVPSCTSFVEPAL